MKLSISGWFTPLGFWRWPEQLTVELLSGWVFPPFCLYLSPILLVSIFSKPSMFNKHTLSGWDKFCFRKSKLTVSTTVSVRSSFYLISCGNKWALLPFTSLPLAVKLITGVTTCTSLHQLPCKKYMPPFTLSSLDKKVYGHPLCHSLMAVSGRNIL